MKTRTVELAIARDDGKWDAEMFVQIPANTPDKEVEQTAVAELQGLWAQAFSLAPRPKDAPDVVHIWLYNSMEDDGEN